MAEVESRTTTWKTRGNKAFREQDYAGAAKCYSEAITLEPSNHILLGNRSASFLAMSNFQGALTDANECIRLKPTWVKGHYRKGNVLVALGDLNGAVDTFEKVLKLDPENVEVLERLQATREALSKRPAGEISRESGDGVASPGKTATAATLTPGADNTSDPPSMATTLPHGVSSFSSEPKQGTLTTWKTRGNKAFREQDYAGAAQCYSEAITLEPSNHILLGNRSASFLGMSNFQGALADANECIRLKPTWVKGHYRKGNALVALGDLNGAVDTFEKVLKLDPENVEVLERLQATREALSKRPAGEISRESDDGVVSPGKTAAPTVKDCESSESPQRKAIPAQENAAKGSTRGGTSDAAKLGNAAFRESAYPEAIKHYSVAIRETPSSYILYSNRSASYFELGQYEKALEDAVKCTELKPVWIKGLFRQGNALAALGGKIAAREVFERALVLDPGNTNLRERLEEVGQAQASPTAQDTAMDLSDMPPLEDPRTGKLVGKPGAAADFSDMPPLEDPRTGKLVGKPGAAADFSDMPPLEDPRTGKLVGKPGAAADFSDM
ncbi:hypothetical protein CYMTET_35431, partial [Cymbomonas tetramitiformis]